MRRRFHKTTLFVSGGLFWIAGGIMVFRNGLFYCLKDRPTTWTFVGMFATFSLFYLLIFKRLALRHLSRIGEHPDETLPIWQIYDLRTYLLIALMSGGGALLRRLSLLPDWFIASFYPGLGAALTVRGLQYLINGVRSQSKRVH